MDTFILIFELVGTVAFAASGAMTGIKKNMDIFGVCILALTTAVGGGVIRDLILGNTPPATFRDPIYAAVALAAALVLFFSRVRRLLMHNTVLFDKAMFWMDTAGLGIFTVVGIRTAYAHVPQATVFLLVFVGVITGVGGGVLRDVLSNQKPYIFVKHFYACPTLIGALLCALCWRHLGDIPSMLLGAAVILVLRLCAAHFRWGLPHAADLPE